VVYDSSSSSKRLQHRLPSYFFSKFNLSWKDSFRLSIMILLLLLSYASFGFGYACDLPIFILFFLINY